MALRVTQTFISVLGADVGVLRPTQTYVSVLGADTGALRVSQTYVQVLTDQIFVQQDITDTLALVQSVNSTIKSESVTSTLALVQSVNSNIKSESASNALALTQSVAKNYYSEAVASSLTLSDTLSSNYVYASASNTLALTQTARPNFFAQIVNQTISLNPVVSTQGSNQSYSTSNFITLSDLATASFAVANRSIEHHLDFVSEEEPGLSQSVNFVYVLEVTSTLALAGIGQVIYAASNTLALTQAVVAATSYEVVSTLDLLDHEVARQIDYSRAVESELDLQQSVAYEVERVDTLCTYTPFVGTNGDGGATVPPPVTPPSLGSATLTLTFPYISPTTTLELRNPEFGNNRTLNFTRIFGETRGGSLIVFSDPIWPKTKSLSVQINGLSESQTEALLDFLGDSLGMEIGLLDWENQQWRGIITTPDAEVSDNGRCNKTVSFQFEGELV
jgi:hypothetical protein